MQTGEWTTKDGGVVKICEMSNHHIVNVMRFLDRMAQETMDRRNKSFDECVRPIYWCMLEEIEDRLSQGKMIRIAVLNNRLIVDGKPVGEK